MSRTRRPSRARNLPLQLAAALVLGIVLTVASAWASALLAHFSLQSTPRRVIIAGLNNTALQILRTPGAAAPALSDVLHQEHAPGISRFVTFNVDNNGALVSHVRESAGWPMRALEHEATCNEYTFDNVRWGFSTPYRDEGRDATGRVVLRIMNDRLIALPLRPEPVGFAVNTAFYATLAWFALILPGIYRRARRRSSNHCPDCNYDRRGIDALAPCPECGVPRIDGSASIRTSPHASPSAVIART